LNFEDLKINSDLLEGLLSMGYKAPTKIQQEAIPVLLDGKDLVACAQTGTGKTAAFLIPVIQHILTSENRYLNTLIIAPTRELALQIDQQIDGLGYFAGVSSIAIYGGNDGFAWDQQRHSLENGADIIVATPGRLKALLQNGSVDFTHLQHLILDEADRMLDMGFFDDIKNIIGYLPAKRQTILFSATMPPKMRLLANQILHEPVSINIAISKPAEGILQQAYVVYDNQKEPILKKVLDNPDFKSVIIFASTKEKVKALERSLIKHEPSLRAFHSDLEQAEREDVMRKFKSRNLRILIGTDILSRGIDVDGISLVVNFDAPPDPEDYIHRIGRTARAEKTGIAITFINDRDQPKFAQIEALMGKEVDKLSVPSEFGKAPEYNPESMRTKKFTKAPSKGGNRNKFRSGKNSGSDSRKFTGNKNK